MPADDDRPDYRSGLPDHHDPTAGLGGAPPARSALTLRLVLASVGLVLCVVMAVVATGAGLPLPFVVLLGGLAGAAVVDILVILRRKRRGEPG